MRFFRAIKQLAAVTSLFALFAVNGGQWFLVQSVAWAEMWSRFSRTESFAQATRHTFDGQHLCGVCKIARHERAKEKAPEIRLELHEFTLTQPGWEQALALRFPDSLRFHAGARTNAPSHPVPPPTPPPRLC
ncbi:MAG: hypothetical protein P4M08_01060 [Oligoflexia bacterium]|nr:hypothetical protein [Oligoflexia bacterium]